MTCDPLAGAAEQRSGAHTHHAVECPNREVRTRCFFNLAGAIYDPDSEGLELASLADARLESVRFIGEFIRDRPDLVWGGEEVRVEVTDANQLILFTVIVLGVDAPASFGSRPT